MVYIGNNTGIVIYSEAGVNKLYMIPGVAQADGSVAWGSEMSIDTSGPVQKIVSTQTTDSYANVTWIENTPGVLKSANITTDGSIIGVGSVITPGDAGSRAEVTHVDVCYDSQNNHIIWAWYENAQSIYNNYATPNQTTIDPSGKDDIDMAFGSAVEELEVTSEYKNIIVQAISSAGGVYWREAYWDDGRWDKNYSDLSSVVVVVSSGAQSLGGVESNNSNIFAQIETSTDTWQTYYASYISGGTINDPSPFGSSLTGGEACLVNTDSGLGYCVLFDKNSNNFKIYEGSSTNPSAGFSLAYTGSLTISATDPIDMFVTMFGSNFAILMLEPATENTVYFIDSNATRTDNYIGNAANSANPGEEVEVFIGLPMINHSMVYSRGDVFYLGPYKYQAIDEHRVLMIIEETVFP
jgi:hypothetical protein